MKLHRKISACLTALCAVALPLASTAKITTSTETNIPPNIVFFLVDDMGYTDPGAFGSDFYETPNIDRLAASGAKFTNAYAACPVCSPSRAALLTGQYPPRLGTTDFFGNSQPNKLKKKDIKNPKPLLPAPYQPYINPSEVTIAEALKQLGYTTFITGKWHLGKYPEYGPEKYGFDKNVGGTNWGMPKSYFSPYGNQAMKDGPKGQYLTDRLASETVKFIENHKDKPFFAYIPFYSVHIPLEARPDLLKKYEEKRRRLGLGDDFTSEGRHHKNRTNHSVPEYAAMVEAVDGATGRVLDTLERLGLADNTVVFFFSDNGGVSTAQGYPTSNAPLRAGKGWLYEGGIREPLIVRWPGVTDPGTVIDTPVIGTDFFPTIYQMAGSTPPADYPGDGVSLVPLLKHGKAPERRALYWHYPHYADQGGRPGSAVRKGKWKLIRFYEDGRTELYNLKRAVGETHNVAGDHPKVVKRLTRDLDNWLKEVDAKFPTPNPAYKKQ